MFQTGVANPRLMQNYTIDQPMISEPPNDKSNVRDISVNCSAVHTIWVCVDCRTA